MKEFNKEQIEAMEYLLHYYEELRLKKTEDAALRNCYRLIQELKFNKGEK